VRAATVLLGLLAAPPLLAGSRVPAVASYQIEATLSKDHRLTGRETITFTNRTRRVFSDVCLHLYLNGFRNDRSTWLREQAERAGRKVTLRKDERAFGYAEVLRVALADGTDLTSAIRFLAPDDGNAADRTLVSIPLPQPLAPGQVLMLEVRWEAKFPRALARTGVVDDTLLAAQWFPKLCAAEESGWDAHQFHAATEFFADFGDYDVTLTIPGELRGRVGATGVLQEETAVGGDQVRVRFLAEDVHDFAFTASPRYVVVRDTFTYTGLPSVDIVLLLQPDHRRVKERYLRAVKAGLAHYGKWFVPYPYPALTVVDPPYGSNVGGMEYPNFITGGASWLAPEDVHSPESVTIHEFGHQVFYGLLASNEFEEAHLDEGFNSWATERTLAEVYGNPCLMKRFFGLPVVFRSVRLPYPQAPRESYLDWQVTSRSDATTVPSYAQLDGHATRMNAYSKTALVLASCERTLGREVWDRVMKTYTTRFAFRHPTTADFRAVVRDVAGPAADALLAEAWGTTGTVDYAVASAVSAPIAPPAGYLGDRERRAYAPPVEDRNAAYESVAVVRRMGEAAWPVDVELRFAGGRVERRRWDGRDSWIRYRITGPELLEVVVDPERKCLLDVDLLNNGLSTHADEAPARRWSHRLRFLAQNVLELFALLGAAR